MHLITIWLFISLINGLFCRENKPHPSVHKQPSAISYSLAKLENPDDELINEFLISLKRKYEEVSKSVEKFSSFINLLSEKLEKLPEEQLDEVQVEILSLVNNSLNKW